MTKHDQSDEAERLAFEIYPIWPIGGTYDDNHFARACWLEGYRAGVSSSADEITRLKAALNQAVFEKDLSFESHNKHLIAEKLKSQKLVEAIERVTGDDKLLDLKPEAMNLAVNLILNMAMSEYANNESGNEG